MDWKERIGRELIGLVLLIVLLLAGLYTSWDMDRSHRAIARQIEDAAWFALAEDWEKARIAAAAAERSWKEHRNLSSLLADHTPMEEIDSLFARIGICSADRSTTEFAIHCAEASRKLEAMGEAHRLTWQNLL